MSSRHGYSWWRQRVYDFLVVALCFSLPFIQVFNRWPFVSYLIALLVLAWLFGGRFRTRWGRARTQPLLLLSAAVYIPYVLGLMHSSNLEAGWATIVLKAPLLIFPLLVASDPPSRGVLRKSLAGFSIATTACILLAVWRATSDGVNDIKGLSYVFLSTQVNLDPSILSMYAAFAMACIAFLTVTRRTRSWWEIVLTAVTCSGLALSIILLSSRTGLLVLAILVVISVVLLTRKRWWFALVVPGALVLLGLIMPNVYREMSMRVTSLFKGSDARSAEPGSVEFRTVVWQVAVDAMEAQPLVGVGTGDVGDVLSTSVAGVSPERVDSNLHAHNQFLQIGVAVGLPAVALFVTSLIWPVVVSLRRRQWLYPVFMVMMIVLMLFHCPLEMQSSLIFFALFNALLMRPAESPDIEHAAG